MLSILIVTLHKERTFENIDREFSRMSQNFTTVIFYGEKSDMTVSIENATFPKFTRSRNSDSSVSRGTNSN